MQLLQDHGAGCFDSLFRKRRRRIECGDRRRLPVELEIGREDLLKRLRLFLYGWGFLLSGRKLLLCPAFGFVPLILLARCYFYLLHDVLEVHADAFVGELRA